MCLYYLLSAPSQGRTGVVPWRDDPPVCTWSLWFRRCGSGARRRRPYAAVPCRWRPAAGSRRSATAGSVSCCAVSPPPGCSRWRNSPSRQPSPS